MTQKILSTLALSLMLSGSLHVMAQSPYVQTYGREPAPREVNPARTTASQAAATNAPVGPSVSDEGVVIQKSDALVAKTFGNQTLMDNINIKPGYEKLPLSMTFVNGGKGAKFDSFKITLGGMDFVSDKDFKGKDSLTMNMTGAVTSGITQLVMKANGPAGATMAWKITSPKPTVTSVNPKEVAIGEKITINGKNFCPDASANYVYIGRKAVPVQKASASALTITIPEGTEPGKQQLTVVVAGVQSKQFPITIKPAPEIANVDHVSTTTGQPVTVSGKGFGTNSSDVQVTISGLPAQVTSVSNTGVTFIVPEGLPNPQWNCPIVVKVGGVTAKDPANVSKVNVQLRVIENQGVPEP